MLQKSYGLLEWLAILRDFFLTYQKNETLRKLTERGAGWIWEEEQQRHLKK